MTREEAVKHFKENYVKSKSAEKIDLVKKYLKDNKEKLVDNFVESFRQICLKIRYMQIEGQKGKIGYINYSMLRTNILDKKHVYIVDAFDKYWYFDMENCRIEYDTSWAFVFLDALEKELEEKRKFYVNKVIKPDLEKVILKEAEKYNQYVIELAIEALPKAVKLKEYKDIVTDDVIEVRVGEYRGISKLVYKEDF